MPDIFSTFTPHPDIACNIAEYSSGGFSSIYANDYPAIFREIALGRLDKKNTFRQLMKSDRFFLAYFVAGWEDGAASGNKPFIVDRCRMLDEDSGTGTVDIWAREHGKSTAITIAGTIQRILNNPECCTVIFSYKKGAADKFLDSIRKLLESEIMVEMFDDICYANPSQQSPFWGLQTGIRVKRKNQIRKENTVEAFGLVEGMPTGGHWDHLVYDDVETDDMAGSPDQLELCFKKLMMSGNLGREGGTEQVIGTYYSHCGVLVKLGNMKKIDGSPMYRLRVYPGTDDGTITGKPVFFSQEYLDSKKTKEGFNTQILCNPTPGHDIRLKYEMFKEIPRSALPSNRVKFVIIDPAGDKDVLSGAKSDDWAMLTVSINPQKDNLGLSDVFIEDAIVDTFSLNDAVSAACGLYRRSGRVSLLAIERVGQSSHYDHIQKSLKEDYGVWLELKKHKVAGGNLLLLSPSGRNKNYRIEAALSWPLSHGKMHIVSDLKVKEKLKEECNKFPYFHVDCLDALAYLYDILADKTTPMLWHEEYDERHLEPDW